MTNADGTHRAHRQADVAVVYFTRQELEDIIENAVERGARKAVERLGLHDDAAPNDVRELRGLIDGWRTVKKGLLRGFAHWVAVALLGLLALGAYIKSGGTPPTP